MATDGWRERGGGKGRKGEGAGRQNKTRGPNETSQVKSQVKIKVNDKLKKGTTSGHFLVRPSLKNENS